MLPSVLARSCRPVTCRVQKRGMAVKKWANMAVKKNKYMEEWNGQREITEKTFKIGLEEAPTFILYIMIIPYGIYSMVRTEFLTKSDRRYHDIV